MIFERCATVFQEGHTYKRKYVGKDGWCGYPQWRELPVELHSLLTHHLSYARLEIELVRAWDVTQHGVMPIRSKLLWFSRNFISVTLGQVFLILTFLLLLVSIGCILFGTTMHFLLSMSLVLLMCLMLWKCM